MHPDSVIDLQQRAALRKEVEILTNYMKHEFSTGTNTFYKKQLQLHKNKQQQSKFKPNFIIYCCRTHSQISQVFSELNKIPKLLENLVVVPLSSRKFTCINPAVNPKDTQVGQNLVNDRWKDQLESNKCPYNQIGELQIESLSSKIINQTSKLSKSPLESIKKVMDIEEVVKEGTITPILFINPPW